MWSFSATERTCFMAEIFCLRSCRWRCKTVNIECKKAVKFSLLFRISRNIWLLYLCVIVCECTTDCLELFLGDFWVVKVVRLVLLAGSCFGSNTHHFSPTLSPFSANFRQFSYVFNWFFQLETHFNCFYTTLATFRSSFCTYQHTWAAKTTLHSCFSSR